MVYCWFMLFFFIWTANWCDVSDGSTSLQTVLLSMPCQTSAEVVINV